MRTTSFFLTVPLLTAALFLTGCGGDDAANGNGDAAATATAKLTHIDGTIELDGDNFTLTPKNGDEPITFTFGPEVERAGTRAIATSGSVARVTYAPGADPVAAAVVPAPELSDDLGSYEGQIVSIDSSSIVIDGPDGERTFTIAAEDAEAFDVPHLLDHKSANEPVRVYFDPAAPDAGVAYEDA